VTQLESGGAAIGVATDIDGEARNASTPDIGADEFAGVGIDLLPPAISYAPLGNTTATTDRPLSITVTDLSGVPTSGSGLPVLYFRKGTSGGFSSSQCSFVSGTSYSCLFTYASVGGVATGDTIQYYLAAQDAAPTPNVTTNPSAGAAGFTADPPAASTPPTTPSSYVIAVALSGTQTVCASGCNHTTLTGATGMFNAINNGVLTGNLDIQILAT